MRWPRRRRGRLQESEPGRPSNPPLLRALRADATELSKIKGNDRGTMGIVDALALPGFWSVALWRTGNTLHEQGLRPLSRLTYALNMVMFGADLPSGAVLGPGLVMPHPVGVAFASDVVLGARCRIMGGVRVGGSGKGGRLGHPTFGDEVWLLDGAKVFGPVTIGDRTVIGTSAVVSQDVDPGMLVLLAKEAIALRIRPRNDLPADEPSADDPPVAEPPVEPHHGPVAHPARTTRAAHLVHSEPRPQPEAAASGRP